MNQYNEYKNFYKNRILKKINENDEYDPVEFSPLGYEFYSKDYPWLFKDKFYKSLPTDIPNKLTPYPNSPKQVHKYTPFNPKGKPWGPTLKGIGVGVGLGLLPWIYDKITDQIYPTSSPPTIPPERFKDLEPGGHSQGY